SINRAKRSRNSIGNGAGMINPPKKGEPQIMSQGNPADSNFYRNALVTALAYYPALYRNRSMSSHLLLKCGKQEQKRTMNSSMDKKSALLGLLRFSFIIFGFLMLPVTAFAQSTIATASDQSATVVTEQFEDWHYRCISEI
ncbi:hypothetical protein, partial [Yoonia sp. R2-816]|uniref:hypothetical protein n=1 Tax=Yoonia sp. R2-816 TaxID=3342638 RepID=UPI00372692B3